MSDFNTPDDIDIQTEARMRAALSALGAKPEAKPDRQPAEPETPSPSEASTTFKPSFQQNEAPQVVSQPEIRPTSGQHQQPSGTLRFTKRDPHQRRRFVADNEVPVVHLSKRDGTTRLDGEDMIRTLTADKGRLERDLADATTALRQAQTVAGHERMAKDELAEQLRKEREARLAAEVEMGRLRRELAHARDDLAGMNALVAQQRQSARVPRSSHTANTMPRRRGRPPLSDKPVKWW